MKIIVNILLLALPWKIRRILLNIVFGYKLHPSSRIGFSVMMPKMLIMEANTSIGNLTICKTIDLVHLKQSSSIGNGNWITGFPSGTSSPHFATETDRRPELIMDVHSAITNRHIIDCTNSILIGCFSTIAGFNSQLLTHSIDLKKSKQKSLPIHIGRYTFVGTNCVIVGGARLPDNSVLSAHSFLNREFTESQALYSGVPAVFVKSIPIVEYLYFSRETGFVY
jgi:serine acetyltransferase